MLNVEIEKEITSHAAITPEYFFCALYYTHFKTVDSVKEFFTDPNAWFRQHKEAPKNKFYLLHKIRQGTPLNLEEQQELAKKENALLRENAPKLAPYRITLLAKRWFGSFLCSRKVNVPPDESVPEPEAPKPVSLPTPPLLAVPSSPVTPSPAVSPKNPVAHLNLPPPPLVVPPSPAPSVAPSSHKNLPPPPQPNTPTVATASAPKAPPQERSYEGERMHDFIQGTHNPNLAPIVQQLLLQGATEVKCRIIDEGSKPLFEFEAIRPKRLTSYFKANFDKSHPHVTFTLEKKTRWILQQRSPELQSLHLVDGFSITRPVVQPSVWHLWKRTKFEAVLYKFSSAFPGLGKLPTFQAWSRDQSKPLHIIVKAIDFEEYEEPEKGPMLQLKLQVDCEYEKQVNQSLPLSEEKTEDGGVRALFRQWTPGYVLNVFKNLNWSQQGSQS